MVRRWIGRALLWFIQAAAPAPWSRGPNPGPVATLLDSELFNQHQADLVNALNGFDDPVKSCPGA